jgi:hypothetical protein
LNGITSFSGGTGAIILVPDQTLPIDWQSFTGTTDNKFNYLNWVTASELNSSHFEVQRSKDGILFENIGSVTAAGMSNSPRSYNHTDRNPYVGINYYRIRMVEIDGMDAYSNVIALEIKDMSNGYVVYPNPTADVVTYESVIENESDFEFTLLDVLGRVLIEKNQKLPAGKNQVQLDLKKLVPGNYTLRIINKSTGKITLEKVVKI